MTNDKIWDKIVSLDLSNVKTKFLTKKSFWWRMFKNSDNIEKEYRQFLYLIAKNPSEMIVPWSQDLDDFWHEHILDTTKYEKDCKKVFGKFIHHNPHIGNYKQQTAFNKTKILYREAFKDKANKKPNSSSSGCGAGCAVVMPVVFCGSSCSSSHASSCSSSSCGSSCSGSSCGSSCGGGCGGGD